MLTMLILCNIPSVFSFCQTKFCPVALFALLTKQLMVFIRNLAEEEECPLINRDRTTLKVS